MRNFILLLSILYISVSSNAQKSETPKLIKTINLYDQTNRHYSIMEHKYDDKNRLTEFSIKSNFGFDDFPEKPDFTSKWIYGKQSADQLFYDTLNLIRRKKITLDKSGFASGIISLAAEGDSIFEDASFTYDENGLLTKHSIKGYRTNDFKNENGNRISGTDDDGLKKYEYYSDKTDKAGLSRHQMLYDNIYSFREGMYFGNANKNLIRKITMTDGETYEYVYTIENGYVKSFICTISGTEGESSWYKTEIIYY